MCRLHENWGVAQLNRTRYSWSYFQLMPHLIYPYFSLNLAYDGVSMIERRIHMSVKSEISGLRNGRSVAGVSEGRRRHHHHRDDFAVEGIQDMGRDLSRSFAKLRRRCKARKLVAAIRHCDRRAVNEIFDWKCREICFFKKPGFDCVKISCCFGRGSAFVTFDICVRSLNRCNGYGNGFYGNGFY